MKNTTYSLALLVSALLITFVSGARADVCSEAKDAAQKYIDGYETIRTMEVDQLKRLVNAVCDADEDERQKVSDDEKSRVESMVASSKSDLDKWKADATSKLSAAISDPQCESKKSELEDKQKDGSNPAFDKLRKMGQMAHDDYYQHHVGDLKPDCILPDACVVIELKPDNSRAKYGDMTTRKPHAIC